MKILVIHRLVRHIATYHFLSFFVVFLVADGVSGRSEIKTKLLLKNIRLHLAQKAEEIVQQKECESGLTLCKSLKDKNEVEEEKSEEIAPPPKIMRGHHKPFIKVSPKDVIHTMMPKVHKSFLRKIQRESDGQTKLFDIENDDASEEESEEDVEEEKPKERQIDKIEKQIPRPATENKNIRRSAQELKVKDKKELKSRTKPRGDEIRKIIEDDEGRSPKTNPRGDEIRKTIEDDEGRSPKKKPRGDEIRKTIKKIEDDEERSPKSVGKKIEIKKVYKEQEIKMKKEPKPTRKEEKFTKEPKTKEDLTFPESLFVFVLDSDEVKTSLCRKHSHIYLNQLKKHKIWALMMYDASAKLPSGILQGNVNQFGDFDECLSINAVFKKPKSKESSGIRGKYCLANFDVSTHESSSSLRQALDRAESFSFIRSTISDPGHFIPRFSSINWGMCVPSTCPADDVEKFIESQLSHFNRSSGLIFDVQVQEENCVVKEDLKFEWKTTTMVTVLFYLVIIGTTIFATHLDSKDTKSEEEPSQDDKIKRELEEASRDVGLGEQYSTNEVTEKTVPEFTLQDKVKGIAMAFSLKRNLKKLFSDYESKDCIQCINGIKSIFTVMLYLAHKVIPLGMTPFSNRIFLTKISNEATTVLLRTSIVFTDSFLLISGVLISYNLSKEISEKGKISWMRKSIARFIRLTPALLAVVLFYAYIWDQLGSGPTWNLLVKKNSDLCKENMWRNLLYIQNFFAFEDMCASQTHQLALDMQLSLLAPFFVYLLYHYDKVGVGILQAFFLLSSIMRYISTSNNQLSVVIYHGMPVFQLYKTADFLYGQTLHRASPYILGSIVGYYLKKYENIDLPKTFVVLCWMVAFSLGFYSVMSPSHLALRNYQYDVHEAAQYAALSPVAWSLALSWLIVACHLGYGGKLNEFLSQKSFLVFSRISYSVYLTQFLVFFYKVGVKRIPEMFTFSGSINVTEFFIVILISVVVTLLFDLPMMDIKNILLHRKPKKLKKLPEVEAEVEHQEKSTGIEEDDISQEDSLQTTDDIDYPEEEIVEEGEEIAEEEGEEGDEEELEEEGDEDEEVEEEGHGHDEDGIDGIQNYELQPLRRSTRILFDDEPEDKEWFKVEDESTES